MENKKGPPPTSKPPGAKGAAAPDAKAKALALFNQLAPAGSAQRRFLPLILLVLVLIPVVLVMLHKSPEQLRAEAVKHVAETTGLLRVKSNRPNTTIEATRIAAAGEAASTGVKGSDEGAAEQTLGALPPGKYAIIARADGWPELHAEAQVDAARTTEVAISFKSGSLRLESDPAGAVVTLAGTTLGKTPLVIPQLPVGETPLALAYPGWPAVTIKAVITENTEATQSVRLPYGKLTVESSPAGATILLGKRALGVTPLTLERVSAGTIKLTLQAKDFPPLEVSARIDDRAEVKVSPELGAGFPELDPSNLLAAVWVPDNPNQLAPGVDSIGRYEPRNGVVKNLNRKRVYEQWLRKTYRYAATVKSYDPQKGRVEFAEQENSLTKYRVLADLSTTARNDKDLVAKLTAKGAAIPLSLYGKLEAVEEPRWPGKVITLELSGADPLH